MLCQLLYFYRMFAPVYFCMISKTYKTSNIMLALLFQRMFAPVCFCMISKTYKTNNIMIAPLFYRMFAPVCFRMISKTILNTGNIDLFFQAMFFVFPVDLVTYAEEILNGILHILCSVKAIKICDFYNSHMGKFYHLKSRVKRIRIFLCLEEQLVSASFLFGIDTTFILLGISCLVTSFSSPQPLSKSELVF